VIERLVEQIEDRFTELSQQLADPEVHTDLTKARKSGRRYAQLAPLIQALHIQSQLNTRNAQRDDHGNAGRAYEPQVEGERGL
jgi:peptide chain release factor 1